MAAQLDIENMVRALPRWKAGLAVRYGTSAALVFMCFLIRWALPIPGAPYLLFIPAVFLSSILFDRGSGYVATVLSALLAVYFFVEPRHSLSLPLVQVPTVVLFVAICAAIATVGEALRKALERAIEAERTNALLLSELNHRTKNNLAVIITLLRLQSRRIEAEAARVPFEQSIERIRVMASMHDHLVQTGGSVQMQAYLSDLSRHLGDTQRGLRPIEVRVDADDVKVRADLASALGLIANELITNAFKYGFPDDRAGSVDLILRNEGGQLRMTVTDDGVGLDPRRPDGLGTKLVKLLAQQHGGTAERRRGVTGTVNEICVPLSE